MGYKANIRAIQAVERRQQRDAQKRMRELERQAKEQAKLSEIEQARLEVETFENRLEMLLCQRYVLARPRGSKMESCRRCRSWRSSP